MILVTGASGNTGGAVLNALLKRGARVRAGYRDPQDAVAVPKGAEAVIADFGRSEQLDTALKGVETVYVVCAPIPQLVEFESNVLAAAKRAGTKRIVKSSAMGAGQNWPGFPAWHRQVEDRIAGSGVPYTFLRPNTFMQNLITYSAASIRDQGVFYGAKGSSRCSFIDVADVGEASASVILDSGHEGKTYELNGPEALTNSEIAAKLARALNREVKYVDLPPEQLRGGMVSSGSPEWVADAILELERYYREGHMGGAIDGVLKRLLGRKPTTFDEFLARSTEAFAKSAAS